MAVFGIGAYDHEEREDLSNIFVNENIATIGYQKNEASSLYEMFRRIKLGDIIYIKSFTPTGGLKIKAIGFITGIVVKENKIYGHGRDVKWVKQYKTNDDWITIHLNESQNKNNVYNNTLYEEYSKKIIEKIINEIISKK